MIGHGKYIRALGPQIEAGYFKALGEGAEDPAVLLLDADDGTARAIARASGRGAEVDAHAAEGRRRGRSATLTWGLSRARAVEFLAGPFDRVAAMVAIPPGGAPTGWSSPTGWPRPS